MQPAPLSLHPSYAPHTSTLASLPWHPLNRQLLGFLEVCRREGPRERNFLETGSLGGSDTLFTLLEGIRFIMCASPATLQVRCASVHAPQACVRCETELVLCVELLDPLVLHASQLQHLGHWGCQALLFSATRE